MKQNTLFPRPKVTKSQEQDLNKTKVITYEVTITTRIKRILAKNKDIVSFVGDCTVHGCSIDCSPGG